MFTYNVTINDGIRTSITAFVNGQPYVATKDHPNFDKILNFVETTDPVDVDDLVDLFDLTKPLLSKFNHLSERVAISNGRIFFDGDEVDNSLSDAIVNFYFDNNDDYIRLVHFMEKLYTNPNAHSRDNLYSWMANNSFSVAPDGDLIAYKGVNRDRSSIFGGKAIVDGQLVEGNIPNNEGSLIEMPRSDVQHNPKEACSVGLHAGTWDYASSFGSLTIKVKINPRDVVSVPTDCNGKKMRVCRYRCLDETGEPTETLQYEYSGDNYDEFQNHCKDDWEVEEDWAEHANRFATHHAAKREAYRLSLTSKSLAEVHNEARTEGVETLKNWGYRDINEIIDDLINVRFPS